MKHKKNLLHQQSFIYFTLASILLSWLAHLSIDCFWIVLPAVSFLLILFSFTQTKIHFSLCSFYEGLMAIFSGIALYVLFWVGNWIGTQLFSSAFSKEVQLLYQTLQPRNLLSWLLLFAVIIPGEEIIWRGVILEKMQQQFRTTYAILGATVLYMLSLIFSISPLLMLAGIGGGLLWGVLYAWKKNLMIPLLSHLIFDGLLLLIFPLQ